MCVMESMETTVFICTHFHVCVFFLRVGGDGRTSDEVLFRFLPVNPVFSSGCYSSKCKPTQDYKSGRNTARKSIKELK